MMCWTESSLFGRLSGGEEADWKEQGEGAGEGAGSGAGREGGGGGEEGGGSGGADLVMMA